MRIVSLQLSPRCMRCSQGLLSEVKAASEALARSRHEKEMALRQYKAAEEAIKVRPANAVDLWCNEFEGVCAITDLSMGSCLDSVSSTGSLPVQR